MLKSNELICLSRLSKLSRSVLELLHFVMSAYEPLGAGVDVDVVPLTCLTSVSFNATSGSQLFDTALQAHMFAHEV